MLEKIVLNMYPLRGLPRGIIDANKLIILKLILVLLTMGSYFNGKKMYTEYKARNILIKKRKLL